MKYNTLAVLSGALFTACSPPQTPPTQAVERAAPITAPAGEYRLDPEHSTIVFRVNHLGFSWYTGAFSDFDATLQFDPETPESMHIEAVIKVPSLIVPAPPEGFHDALLGADWFKADEFPEMTFRSTKVTQSGERAALVEGEFTMLGVTKPVVLETEFVGGYPGFHPHDPQARVGFSAHGTLNRSDYGLSIWVPDEPGQGGIGDEISFRIDVEFLGPPTPSEITEIN